MYIDYILFAVGGVCALATAVLGIYLLVSSKPSKNYREMIKKETEFVNMLTTTTLFTRRGTGGGGAAATTIGGEALRGAGRSGVETILDDGLNDTMKVSRSVVYDFDATALEGRYILQEEIHGGGMSRVFLAKSASLGNPWIVKFIPNEIGMLSNEEEILKVLNHISLPSIIDIFRDDKGIYLVESFIEGVSLDKLIEESRIDNQVLVIDWAQQIAQVLDYLHNLKPDPIYHFDLKPSNVIMTHSNKLVVIDFGISKRHGRDDDEVVGVTLRYAAPEQMLNVSREYQPYVAKRFGILPESSRRWTPDSRTDLYSLGVIIFELLTGYAPECDNLHLLKSVVSKEFYSIVMKCLEVEPNKRYQSAKELLSDLQKLRLLRGKMEQALLIRKIVAVASAFTLVVSGSTTFGGYYVYAQESAAVLGVSPGSVTVSLQQSSELVIEKVMPNGKIVALDAASISWNFGDNNVARIDGNRIAGMNTGQTVVTGKYRNKDVTLNINVVEPMNGMVDISQRYFLDRYVEVFAGTTERQHVDGALSEAEFVSPEGIATDNSAIYLADSGVLRRIRNGYAETINFEESYIRVNTVRCSDGGVYILTNEWQDGDNYYYGIIRLKNNTAEMLFTADAIYTAIDDFAIYDGLLYYINRNAGIGDPILQTLNLNDLSIDILCELPEGTVSLTIDDDGVIYFANEELGVILKYENSTVEYFAGVENEKAFVDGAAPLFYMPASIKYNQGFIYVWDFNVLRRITVVNGFAAECITIAGEASPSSDYDILKTKEEAENIILPNSKLTEIEIFGDTVLITDPKRSVIWKTES